MLLVVAMTGGSQALHVTGPGLSGLQQGVPKSLPRAIATWAGDGEKPLRLAGGAGDKAAVKTFDVGHRGKLSYAWDALDFSTTCSLVWLLSAHLQCGLCA